MMKLDEWFGARKWRVQTEADGYVPDARFAGQEPGEPVVVTFRQGKFEVHPPGSFTSPVGSRGRSGVLLQEVDADGKDIEGSLQPWGHAAVKKAREEFHAIV
jgi:hypothetical protein